MIFVMRRRMQATQHEEMQRRKETSDKVKSVFFQEFSDSKLSPLLLAVFYGAAKQTLIASFFVIFHINRFRLFTIWAEFVGLFTSSAGFEWWQTINFSSGFTQFAIIWSQFRENEKLCFINLKNCPNYSSVAYFPRFFSSLAAPSSSAKMTSAKSFLCFA